ncbi:MAG: hypothetical protein WCQ90_13415, partial [Deltaproteobacteria bacterium]
LDRFSIFFTINNNLETSEDNLTVHELRITNHGIQIKGRNEEQIRSGIDTESDSFKALMESIKDRGVINSWKRVQGVEGEEQVGGE